MEEVIKKWELILQQDAQNTNKSITYGRKVLQEMLDDFKQQLKVLDNKNPEEKNIYFDHCKNCGEFNECWKDSKKQENCKKYDNLKRTEVCVECGTKFKYDWQMEYNTCPKCGGDIPLLPPTDSELEDWRVNGHQITDKNAERTKIAKYVLSRIAQRLKPDKK